MYPRPAAIRPKEALNLQEFSPEQAAEITAAMDGFESVWGIHIPTDDPIPVRKVKQGGVYVPGGETIYVGIDDAGNNAVHEMAHWLHHRSTRFGFETDHRWKPPSKKQFLEEALLSTHPEKRQRQIEQFEAISELWKELGFTESHKSRMQDMRSRRPAKQLVELAKPREIFARTVERVTAHALGLKQPSYGLWNFYTTLTNEEMNRLIPYVRRFIQSLGKSW